MNLFIIRTPFQAYLAEKIIKQKNIDKIITIYISPSNNCNQKEAYERIKNLSSKSYYMHLGENKTNIKKLFKHIKVFIEILKLKLKECGKFDNIYISSIDSVPIQLAVSYVHFENLYTFDDGSANYNYTGKYFSSYKSGFILGAISKIFGRKFSQIDLLHISDGHFAVLPNKKNIHSKVFPVDMGLNVSNSTASYKYKSCNILIGIPYDIISNNPEQLMNDIKNNMNIDYYIPHPRLESSDFLKDKLFTKNNSIAELKVEYLLKEYKQVNVYAFHSTVLFTLRNIERVRLFLICHKSLKPSKLHDELKSIISNYNLN